jgi:transcription elongation factor GreA
MVRCARIAQADRMRRADRSLPAPLLTRAEFGAHRTELEELRRARDRDLPALLRETRGFVTSDAVEEIAQIRADHVFLEARIARLETLLEEASVADDDERPDVACLGRAVTVEYVRTGKAATYRLVGASAAGGPRSVTAGSPLGKALIGRATGDVVSVGLPAGRVEELRIVAVTTVNLGGLAAGGR